jgi:hypothetical protein
MKPTVLRAAAYFYTLALQDHEYTDSNVGGYKRS